MQLVFPFVASCRSRRCLLLRCCSVAGLALGPDFVYGPAAVVLLACCDEVISMSAPCLEKASPLWTIERMTRQQWWHHSFICLRTRCRRAGALRVDAAANPGLIVDAGALAALPCSRVCV